MKTYCITAKAEDLPKIVRRKRKEGMRCKGKPGQIYLLVSMEKRIGGKQSGTPPARGIQNQDSSHHGSCKSL
jgi:hypothetical protein